ncbi:MAG: chemotaxis protein CheC [Myxococcota bacterium]
MSESKHGLALQDLGELSALGASCAANALGLILGRDVVAGASRQVDAERYRPSVNWSTGVIFEADGVLSGLVAILLPAPSPATLAALAVGERQDGNLESALRELGNIVASHTVSAIADDLGGSILLSVPTLVMDGADRFLVTLAGEHQAAYCFESDLFGSDGERVAALVFVPEFALAENSA